MLCIVHQAIPDSDDEEFYICRRCRPAATRLHANLQLEIDLGLIDPRNTEDERVAGYRVLSFLLPEMHDKKLVRHTPHHGAAPLASQSTRKLVLIGLSDCDCYSDAERAEARQLAQQRPDVLDVMEDVAGPT